MVNIITDIVVAASAIVVAVAAIVGINTWRKELSGKATFEAAKKMMGSGYKVVDSYQWTVGLMTSSGEFIDRSRQSTESDAMKQVLDEWYAKSKRFELLLKNYNNLSEANWEVRTVIGSEAAKGIEGKLISIKSEIVSLSSAIFSYFDIRRREADYSGTSRIDPEFVSKMHNIIYQSTNSDENKKLNSLVTDLEKELAPYLRGAGRRQSNHG
jgi:TfoX/Sxy family transcriptional regulator of competence genes